MSQNGERKRHYFSRADEMKAKIAAKFETYLALHEKAAINAAEKGNSAPAEWLLSHAELREDDGSYSRPIGASIDRPQVGDGKPTGPTINIGFLGTAPQPATITVTTQPALEPANKQGQQGQHAADASMSRNVSALPPGEAKSGLD